MTHGRWTRLEALFAAARSETAPPVDVTRAVLGRIAQQAAQAQPAAQPEVERTLAWCALGSVAAAGLVAILASGAVREVLDPLTDLMQSCDVVLR